MTQPKLLTVKQYNEICVKSLEAREDALGRKMSARSKIELRNLQKELDMSTQIYPPLAY